PSVTSTTPAAGASGVLANTTITVNFSEAVTAPDAAFSLACPTGTPKTFTKAPSGATVATSFTLTPSALLPAGVTCVLTVDDAQVTDNQGDHPSADFTASFGVETAPTVTSTTPLNAASGVSVGSTLSVTFDRAVTAPDAAFTLECPSGTAKTFTR